VDAVMTLDLKARKLTDPDLEGQHLSAHRGLLSSSGSAWSASPTDTDSNQRQVMSRPSPFRAKIIASTGADGEEPPPPFLQNRKPGYSLGSTYPISSSKHRSEIGHAAPASLTRRVVYLSRSQYQTLRYCKQLKPFCSSNGTT
jgi:hypothetical protein